MEQQPIFSYQTEGPLFSSPPQSSFFPFSPPKAENPPLRVAAYIRVSTDSRRQEDSYQRQEEYFTSFFASHPEWQAVGIYSDHGLSATSQQKRVGFQRLLRHCREGRVQRIFCKSISRFARNTEDFMAALSALRQGGATIYFETEHLDTAYYTNEFILTTLAALAQEESRSLSQNIRWGIQKHYQTGDAKNLPIYGYRYALKQDENHRLPQVEIVEDQAKVVRWIFQQAALGKSFQSIARALNKMEIPPPETIWTRKHKRLREGAPPKLGERRDEVEIGWTGEQISRMLKTERYAGDLLLQKKFKVDFSSDTLCENRGELPKYQVEGHHPAIVHRDLFEQVQNRFSPPRNTSIRSRHPFSKRLVCVHCGRYYTIKRQQRTPVWYCPTAALSNGIKSCQGETWREQILYEMFFQGVLLRFLSSNRTKPSFFEIALQEPLPYIAQVTPKLQQALYQLEQTDQVETQRSLFKRQIQALENRLSHLEKNHQSPEKQNQLRQRKEALEQTLQQREQDWELVEQGYPDRKELMEFLKQPWEKENLEDWCAHLIQPLVLSIHLFPNRRFWIHWFDDTFTRLTLSPTGIVTAFDYCLPANTGPFLREGEWEE